MGATARVVRVGVVGLTVKGESRLGLSVVDLELKAPSIRPRNRGELKYDRMVGRIGSVEAKGKEGVGVEQEERKSLRKGVPLDRMTGVTGSSKLASRRLPVCRITRPAI